MSLRYFDNLLKSLYTVARMNEPATPDWEKIAAMPEFQALLKAKRRFVVPCCIFFTIYYFSLLYLVGWHTEMVKKVVLGHLNIAYLFALSQFFMAWIMAFLYTKKSSKFDQQAAAFLDHAGFKK